MQVMWLRFPDCWRQIRGDPEALQSLGHRESRLGLHWGDKLRNLMPFLHYRLCKCHYWSVKQTSHAPNRDAILCLYSEILPTQREIEVSRYVLWAFFLAQLTPTKPGHLGLDDVALALV